MMVMLIHVFIIYNKTVDFILPLVLLFFDLLYYYTTVKFQ